MNNIPQHQIAVCATSRAELADELAKWAEIIRADGLKPLANAAPAEPAKEEPAPKARKAKKVEEAPPTDTPREDDKAVTPNHPKRAELRTIAQEYKEATSMTEAQRAMKLYGESSSTVPDADLGSAIGHFKNLIKNLSSKAAQADQTI